MEPENLAAYADRLLDAQAFQDYAPNGMQVRGRRPVRRLVSGVTACQALLDEAVRLDADAVLVHHGYFWKGESPCINGMKAERLRTLLTNDMSLFAYHLPLDAHAELGNNACLAGDLDLTVTGTFETGTYRPLGMLGAPREPLPLDAFAERVAAALGRQPTVVAGGDHPVRRVAWCSGGAQGFIDHVATLGVDLYFSGEISEPTVHTARECGLHYLAAGHHATERGGARALGEHLAARFDLEHHFIDIDSPA
ncbi:Nif3-like dinuclear metal center hexameric protein [Aquisalimonas sp. APHAB1-3]|uniref:Nif3-like dinuclear metal center hexameric protein n=1 Tax=unclassified Aquisalimonas TaxID=2644645 RepID=UPI0025BCF228|nr:Nif3-like dinuclear metal center hexameric protein [Aquisalimonas sp.]